MIIVIQSLLICALVAAISNPALAVPVLWMYLGLSLIGLGSIIQNAVR